MQKAWLLTGVAAAATLTAGFLSYNAGAQSRQAGPSSIPTQVASDLLDIQLAAWRGACETMGMTLQCRDIPPPRVGYGLLSDYGNFDVGARTVLVDLRLLGQEFGIVVMMHEMTHYLQDKRSPLRGGVLTTAEKCKDEKEAWNNAFAWAAIMGLAQSDNRLTDWDGAYDRYYGCPR